MLQPELFSPGPHNHSRKLQSSDLCFSWRRHFHSESLLVESSRLLLRRCSESQLPWSTLLPKPVQIKSVKYCHTTVLFQWLQAMQECFGSLLSYSKVASKRYRMNRFCNTATYSYFCQTGQAILQQHSLVTVGKQSTWWQRPQWMGRPTMQL
jgi:hypothetical protein